MSSLTEKARGQWHIILERFGVDGLCLDGKHHPCPACGGHDRFRFDDKEGRGTHFCNQCGAGDGVDLVGKLGGYPDFKTTAAEIEAAMGWSGEALSEADKQAYKAKMQTLRQERIQQEKEAQKQAATKAKTAWKMTEPATQDNAPYLKTKGVQAHGVRVAAGCLVVPVRDEAGALTSIQTIKPNGSKTFTKGGRVGGCYHRIVGKGDYIVVVEGYATGASIYEATGYSVAVAFNADNLLKVAKCIFENEAQRLEKDHDATARWIIISADNDRKNDSNKGLECAIEAAEMVTGTIALPPEKIGFGNDWNDVHCEFGIGAVYDGFEITKLITAKEAQLALDNQKPIGKPQPEQQPQKPSIVEGANIIGLDVVEGAKPSMKALPLVVDEWDDPESLPSELLPVQSFNPEILPDVFRDYVLDVSDRMQCPIEFVAVSLMTTFGGVVGKRCSIYPKAKDDWLVVPNLWGALVGRPSTMKSPAITAATAGVDSLVKDARAQYTSDCGKIEVNKMVHDAKKKAFKDVVTKAVKAEKDIPDDLPKPPEQPKELRYITNAGSVENLIQLLSENENGIIQLRDELIGWIRSMDNSASQDARSFYLEAWNGTGSSFSYDTMSHGHLCLETGACISVLGGIQPSLLAGIVHSAEQGRAGDDGMIQRFQLLVYPDDGDSWQYRDRKPNKNFTLAMKQAFTAAVSISGKARFDDEAQPIFIDWYTDLMQRVRHEEHLGMSSHLSKYPQLMPALALLIHIAEHTAQVEPKPLSNVSKSAALKAVAWCSFLESHARRIYAMGNSANANSARKVIQLVIDGKLPSTFKLGELQRKTLSGLKGEQANGALEMLEMYGWAMLKTEATGGRPSTICTIHPRAEYFTTPPQIPTTKPTKGGKRGFSGFSGGV